MISSRLASKPLVALSLFSGAGGMDIGIQKSGFEVLSCIEIDPHCADTLRDAATREKRNTEIIQEDIRTINPVAWMRSVLLDAGDLDLLFGGSPCQSFSQIGKRGFLEDERGLLLFEFVRFAEALRPKTILIEQVKGMLTAPDATGVRGGVFARLIAELKALDYSVQSQVINAADYGVPQLRQRVFIVCTRDLPFVFPSPTHSVKPTSNLFSPVKPWCSVGEVLQDLSVPVSKGGFQPEDSHMDVTPVGDRRRIHGVPEGGHLAAQLHLPDEQRCRLTKKDTTKFLRLHREKPSNTLRCGEIFYHPLDDRYLTPREYMRIHGYPDDYLLKGPIRGRSGQVRFLDQHRQVSNSVPPPVAYVIGCALVDTLSSGRSVATGKKGVSLVADL